MILSVNGERIVDESMDSKEKPIELMSVTKSIVSLAVGILIKQNRISSLETPVHEFFSEWNHGLKKEVTLKHILNHTSGLKANLMILLADSCGGAIPLLKEPLSHQNFRDTLRKIFLDDTRVEEFISFANKRMLPTRNSKIGEPMGFSATGYLGQYLMIVPSKNIVAVR